MMYSMTGGPKGLPIIGMLHEANRRPLKLLVDNALRYGDIIPFHVMGQQVVQVNHPDLIRHVLLENHKNYKKSHAYIRFESVIGKGLFTSNGDKWLRDRQRIQPMFRKEQIEGYYFDVVNHVAEKYKQRWFELTEEGPAEINITEEMADITIEIILCLLFGKDALDQRTIDSLHHAYNTFFDYLKHIRTFPRIDLERIFHTPRYLRFRRELHTLQSIINGMIEKYKGGRQEDRLNMLTLLLAAQSQDPENFTDQNILDQCTTMVFAGYETTSIVMQWMWYMLDARPDIEIKLRDEILRCSPLAFSRDSSGMAYDDIEKMTYLGAFFMETMRLFPPLWVTSRQPVEEDWLGGFKVTPSTVVVLPQIIMHRHPRWWQRPEAFIPERFMPAQEEKIDPGLYFPFSLGPRKCSGFRLAEMEGKAIFAKLLPFFRVKALNVMGNEFDPGLTFKLKDPLRVQIRRL